MISAQVLYICGLGFVIKSMISYGLKSLAFARFLQETDIVVLEPFSKKSDHIMDPTASRTIASTLSNNALKTASAAILRLYERVAQNYYVEQST